MTHQDLERELRNHYRSIDVGSSGRAAARVEEALDRAPARRWSLGRLIAPRVVLGAALAVAAIAVVGVALMPFWRAPATGPGTSPTPSQATSPTASPSPTASVFASPWTTDVRAAEVSEMRMTPAGVIWATRGDALSISTDNGRTWKENVLPGHVSPQPEIVDIAVADADHAWQLEMDDAASGTLVVFRTSDGGATWQRADLSGMSYGGVPIQMTFVDSKVGFVMLTAAEGTKMGPTTVLRTQDGGATWAVTATTPILEDPIVALDANTLWTAALWGGMSSDAPGRPLLRVSRDAGATWSSVSLPGFAGSESSAELYVLGGPWGGVQFLSATEGYVALLSDPGAGAKTRYFRTTDGGITWSLVATELQGGSIAPAFVDATHWYRQSAPGNPSVQVTTDGGASWTTIAGQGFEFETGIIDLWTVDGQNAAAFCSVNPPSGGLSALYLTWDGGRTWQPADFSAR